MANYSILEVQQIINSCFCLSGSMDFIKGDDFVQKSIEMAKIIEAIKVENGVVNMESIRMKILR